MNEYRILSAEEWAEFAAVFEALGYDNPNNIARFVDSRLKKEYDVFLLDQNRVLKKSAQDKANYDRYFSGCDFSVPPITDCFQLGEDVWITMPYINGTDARYCGSEDAACVGAELAKIQSHYLTFGGHTEASDQYFTKTLARFWAKIHVQFPACDELFSFIRDRFFSAPHSLIHDDLLPINVLLDKQKIWIIDWSYAEILPYFLDLARFTLITDENHDFFISKTAMTAFLNSYYENMRRNHRFNVDRQQFYCDVAISAFCQYAMFLFYANDTEPMKESINYRFLKQIIAYLDTIRQSARSV